MSRHHLFEFEDQSWFPQSLRRFMTDYLFHITDVNAWLFKRFANLLKRALIQQGEHHIVDLCSGGAGPLPKITAMLAQAEYPVTVTMTDYYPNLEAFSTIRAQHEHFDFMATSVNALDVPSTLTGFRTILSGFHHFAPDDARKILADAAAKKQGIAIMELVGKTPFSFCAVALTPLFMAALTPRMRPRCLWRMLFTYALPLIPIFTMWDGFVSCLRVYTVDELRHMSEPLCSRHYRFTVGTLPILGGIGAITYVIGTKT